MADNQQRIENQPRKINTISETADLAGVIGSQMSAVMRDTTKMQVLEKSVDDWVNNLGIVTPEEKISIMKQIKNGQLVLESLYGRLIGIINTR